MSVIRVASRVHDYVVRFFEDTAFLSSLEQLPHRLYVIDARVWAMYAETLLRTVERGLLLLLPAEEHRKSIDSVFAVYDALLARAAKKNMTLISIGGGIIQDVTGYAASTLYRGIRWLYVPTTLLAQADSCIGAKTSLNYQGYKNVAGTFYPPHEIYISPAFLPSLSDADFCSGLGEVIKLHLMGGAATAQALLADLPQLRHRDPHAVLRAIQQSLEVKLGYIQGDEFDTGRRNLLNFGHCFGHALEATSNFQITHGQAVLIGMLFANRVACRRGLLAAQTMHGLEEALVSQTLVVRPAAAQLEVSHLFEAMQKDKKRTGNGLPLVMMTDGYEFTKVDDLDYEELAATTREVAKVLGLIHDVARR